MPSRGSKNSGRVRGQRNASGIDESRPGGNLIVIGGVEQK